MANHSSLRVSTQVVDTNQRTAIAILNSVFVQRKLFASQDQ
jgi:hypothetical protein